MNFDKQPELDKAARTLLWLAREKSAREEKKHARSRSKSPAPPIRAGNLTPPGSITRVHSGSSTPTGHIARVRSGRSEGGEHSEREDDDQNTNFGESPLLKSFSVPFGMSHMDSFELTSTSNGICSSRRKSITIGSSIQDDYRAANSNSNRKRGYLELVSVSPKDIIHEDVATGAESRVTYFEANWTLYLPTAESEKLGKLRQKPQSPKKKWYKSSQDDGYDIDPPSLEEKKQMITHSWRMQFTISELVAVETHMHRIYGHGKSRFRYSIRRKLLEAQPWRKRNRSDGPKGWNETIRSVVVWLFWWFLTIASSVLVIGLLTQGFVWVATSNMVRLTDIIQVTLLPSLQLVESDEEYVSNLLVHAAGFIFACFQCASLFQLARVVPTLVLPARILLENDHTHVATVRETLARIAANPKALHSMTVCSFLGIGAATWSGMSSTIHEGKVFVRRHGKTTWKQSSKQARRCSVCCLHCTWKFRIGFATHSYLKRWAVLTDTGIVLFRDAMDETPSDVILFDPTFSMYRKQVSGRNGVDAHKSEPVDEDQAVFVVGATGVLELRLPTKQATDVWTKEINRAATLSSATSDHRHSSSFAVRFATPKLASRAWMENSFAEWLRCGRITFWEIARAIGHAKWQVCIADWYLTPHIRLIRIPPGCSLPDEFKEMPDAVHNALETDADGSRFVSLSGLLSAKLAEVPYLQVFVLVLDEVPGVLPNNSAYVVRELDALGKNVHVLTHRSSLSLDTMWSHHEKIVLVDQLVAFIGGLDLCLERYDWPEQRVVDPQGVHWKGKDYCNPRVRDVYDVENEYVDMYPRTTTPRMPWVDVQVKLYGLPAKDVAMHYVQRWNFARKRQAHKSHSHWPVLVPLGNTTARNEMLSPHWVKHVDERNHEPPLEDGGDGTTDTSTVDTPYCRWLEPTIQFPPFTRLESQGAGSPSPNLCNCQIVRSVAEWSSGLKQERSIHTAYIDAIYAAKNFVYIENQYFCSGVDGDNNIGNRIADALVSRIIQAHRKKEQFHVLIVLPLIPAVEGPISPDSSAALMSIMSWQYRTISRGEGSMFQRLIDSEVRDPSQYISIHSLRNYGVVAGNPVTELVYVHSKVMVVDDETAIIGSANLNDRSLLGMRDSEIAVVIEEAVGNSAENISSSKGEFCKSLRCAMQAQHFGVTLEEMNHEPWCKPASPEFIAKLRERAAHNTAIYDEVFGCIPTDEIVSWSQLLERRSNIKEPGKLATSDLTREIAPEDRESAIAMLKEIKGFIVDFPLDFLSNEEDLWPTGFHLENFLPRDLTI